MNDYDFNPLGAMGLFFNPDEKPDTTDRNRTPDNPAKDMRMRLMTCNVMNTPDLPRAAVVGVGRAISGRAGIIGCQEIGETEDHLDMRTGLGSEYGEVFRGERNPIFYVQDAWKVTDAHSRLTHPGLARTSGPRFINWATFHSRQRENLNPFVVVNTHFVSGAWNNSFNSNDSWRREKWHAHFGAMRDLIQRLTQDGKDVFVIGDMNRGSIMPMPKFVNKERQFVPQGIDKISFIPGANSPLTVDKISGPHRINTPSDHDAVMVVFELGEKPANRKGK